MKVLVTGSGGFIGRHVVKELRRRGCVVCEAHKRDLTSTPAIDDLFTEKIDCVVHCAAVTDGMTSYWANVIVSKKLARMCSERKIRFVFFSSGAVYSTNKEINSRTKENPLTTYGKEKLEVQKYLYTLKKLDFAIVFPNFPYGEGQPSKQLIPRLKDRISRREEVFVRDDGGPFIQPVQVEKISEYVAKLLRKKVLGRKKHFVSGGKTLSMLGLITGISEELKIAPRIVVCEHGRGEDYVFKK